MQCFENKALSYIKIKQINNNPGKGNFFIILRVPDCNRYSFFETRLLEDTKLAIRQNTLELYKLISNGDWLFGGLWGETADF